MKPSPAHFKKTVLHYYKRHGRHALPWRKTRNPYNIFVSEIMLQQTQVDRVMPKYKEFLKRFPSFRSLADAKTADVIRAWQGLGYNRRVLALKRACEIIVQKHGGKLPRDYEALVSLPGIGPYTAGALFAFIWNEPVIFIETNIRSVYITHFAELRGLKRRLTQIHDKELLPLIEKTLDKKNPRRWYYALMDYGAYLKKTHGNQNTKSRHYTKQSAFTGSNRQLRGAILKLLSEKPHTEKEIATHTNRKTTDVRRVLTTLATEGFIRRRGNKFSLK